MVQKSSYDLERIYVIDQQKRKSSDENWLLWRKFEEQIR